MDLRNSHSVFDTAYVKITFSFVHLKLFSAQRTYSVILKKFIQRA